MSLTILLHLAFCISPAILAKASPWIRMTDVMLPTAPKRSWENAISPEFCIARILNIRATSA
ncbi:hypothetical protein CHELA40_13301 [Chelatococcus asaccharovorans]|nr:hypothetical protein CHELA40_13301 [Chelatococcus asaccharovorans]CAH1678976.1 hypothetical protein CHELA17_62319 [Chelatococcus asaccharovorans]